MNINIYHDLRVLPDLALIELAAKCFKLLKNGVDELEGYFNDISKELDKRNQNYINLAHQKSLDLVTELKLSDIKDKISTIDYSEMIELYKTELFEYKKDTKFVLIKVTGDSMTYSNIIDGDTILVLVTDEIKSGEIIVIEIEKIKFVKLYKEIDGKKFLISSNPNYPKFELNSDYKYKIIGRVIKSVRNIYEK